MLHGKQGYCVGCEDAEPDDDVPEWHEFNDTTPDQWVGERICFCGHTLGSHIVKWHRMEG